MTVFLCTADNFHWNEFLEPFQLRDDFFVAFQTLIDFAVLKIFSFSLLYNMYGNYNVCFSLDFWIIWNFALKKVEIEAEHYKNCVVGDHWPFKKAKGSKKPGVL